MRQGEMFSTSVGGFCQHLRWVDAQPVDHGECVNVDRLCVDCGIRFQVVSWTKEAWTERTTRESQ